MARTGTIIIGGGGGGLTLNANQELTLVNSALVSASILILPVAPPLSPQAAITNASFTETQAITSTPLALISSAFST